MNQISIKNSMHNTSEVNIDITLHELEIKPAGKKIVFISKFCSVTYLEFLHAHIIHIRHFKEKGSGETYPVPFSVNCKMPFFNVS